MDEAVQTGLGMPVAVLTSVLFVSVAAVVISLFVLRHRYQLKTLETLQSALDGGSELTSALANMLEMRSDLRRGVVSLVRALACIALGIAIQISPARPEDAGDVLAAMWILIGLAAFPGFFGIALIGFHIVDARSRR